MINNHILSMSGAVYWLGTIFFWKIMEFFVTFEWFRHVDPWNQVLLQNPINQSHYTPSLSKINAYLKNIIHGFFFLILSYDVYIRAHGIFFFKILWIFFMLKSQYYLKYSYMQKQRIFCIECIYTKNNAVDIIILKKDYNK